MGGWGGGKGGREGTRLRWLRGRQRRRPTHHHYAHRNVAVSRCDSGEGGGAEHGHRTTHAMSPVAAMASKSTLDWARYMGSRCSTGRDKCLGCRNGSRHGAVGTSMKGDNSKRDTGETRGDTGTAVAPDCGRVSVGGHGCRVLGPLLLVVPLSEAHGEWQGAHFKETEMGREDLGSQDREAVHAGRQGTARWRRGVRGCAGRGQERTATQTHQHDHYSSIQGVRFCLQRGGRDCSTEEQHVQYTGWSRFFPGPCPRQPPAPPPPSDPSPPPPHLNACHTVDVFVAS